MPNSNAANLFAFVTKQSSSLPSWLSSLSRSHSGTKKFVTRKLSRLSTSSRKSTSSQDGDSPLAASSPTHIHNDEPQQQYILPGGGFLVQRGAVDVADTGCLYRLQPNVYSTSTAVCALFGCLSNTDELVEHFMPGGSEYGFKVAADDEPSQLLHLVENTQVGSPRAAFTVDQSKLSAELILRLYQSSDGNNMLLLSELQGQYSFVIYDSDKRAVFAARDPSDGEALFFAIDDDGAVSISNCPGQDTSDEHECEPGEHAWQEIPPGHYLAGKPPKVQQFALTPEQLSLREYIENRVDDLSLSDGNEGQIPSNLNELLHTANRSPSPELFAVST